MTFPADLPRLSLSTLDSVGAAVERPSVDPRATSVGVVHLGVGAFHRAHQAVFIEEAAAVAGEDHWGILGVTGRSPRVGEQLAPQDGLYGVLTKGRETTSLRVIGSMRGAAALGGARRGPSASLGDRPASRGTTLTKMRRVPNLSRRTSPRDGGSRVVDRPEPTSGW